MSVTLEISEETFQRLAEKAKSNGKKNVEQLLNDLSLESDAISEIELERRRELGQRIKAFRKKMFEKYGTMPDSTKLIREDRDR